MLPFQSLNLLVQKRKKKQAAKKSWVAHFLNSCFLPSKKLKKKIANCDRDELWNVCIQRMNIAIFLSIFSLVLVDEEKNEDE